MFSVQLFPGVDLRPLEPWQASEFVEHLDRARDHVRPWVAPSFVATDVSSARIVLQRYADGVAEDSMRLFGIWDHEVLVGGVMLFNFSDVTGVCEAGCWLEPAGEGRGLMTEALRRVLDWTFRVRGLRRVEWRTLASNQPSRKLAARLGLAHEGTLRKVYGDDDQEVWAVLAEDWQVPAS